MCLSGSNLVFDILGLWSLAFVCYAKEVTFLFGRWLFLFFLNRHAVAAEATVLALIDFVSGALDVGQYVDRGTMAERRVRDPVMRASWFLTVCKQPVLIFVDLPKIPAEIQSMLLVILLLSALASVASRNFHVNPSTQCKTLYAQSLVVA